MTDQQINQRIAEACGWTELEECSCGFKQRGNPPEWSAHKKHIPDYCIDLNAMHEAEMVLDSWSDYVNYQSWLGYCGGNAIVQLQQCITATARQRAEAFLRTMGKWEEVQG